MSCNTYPGSKVSDIVCRVKYIDRNNIKANITATLSEPVKGFWIQGVGYYKYNYYQKIATEYWDDVCAWSGGKNSFILDYFQRIIKKFSNLHRKCPISGTVYARTNNMSLQELAFPQIIPAGRYRLDVNFTEGDRKTILASIVAYGSISDHRLEVV